MLYLKNEAFACFDMVGAIAVLKEALFSERTTTAQFKANQSLKTFVGTRNVPKEYAWAWVVYTLRVAVCNHTIISMLRAFLYEVRHSYLDSSELEMCKTNYVK